MNTKVLLIMPALQKDKEHHHFPFGVLALASSLEHIGISYDIFDERVTNPESILDSIKNYSIVGITMFSGYQTHRGCYWLKTVRKYNPDAITIAGGPHVTATPEETADSPLVDYAISGFAENAFANLVLYIASAKKRENALNFQFPGVYSKNDNKDGIVIGMPTPKKYNDIQWAPIPYHKIDVQSYINPETRYVMYISQYGCPALCTFCATPETRKWTSKPLNIVYEDLDKLKQLTNFDLLWFADATLFTNRKRALELIEHLDTNFIGDTWVADARALELIKYSGDDLKKMRNCRMNLTKLVVGLESGSEKFVEKVLKKGKGHLRHFYEVAKNAHAANIVLISGVIFGFPGETINDLHETRKYISEIRKIHPNFKISTTFFGPLPGTDLYDTVREQGYLNINSLEEWAEYGSENHYEYNKWSNPPWFTKRETKIYLDGYQRFMDEHGDICV